MIHSIPIINCLFDRTLDVQIKLVYEKIAKKLVYKEKFDNIRKGRTAQSLFQELLATRPSSEDLVFTHGDYCLPNILIKANDISGFIDVGNAGIADRYPDLALGARSLTSNFDEKLVPVFFQEYGLQSIDTKKLEFYQLLDEFF